MLLRLEQMKTMAICSRSTSLTDTATGAVFTRWAAGEMTMTTEITPHPYRQLKGKAFVSLRETKVFTDDDVWERIVGLRMTIWGGVELDVDGGRLDQALEDIEECDQDWNDAAERRPDLFTVDNELLVPAVVNDVDYPPARILVRFQDLQKAFQQVEVGEGVNARGTSREDAVERKCGHIGKQMMRVRGCRPCFRRFWTMKARERGVIGE